ncbi:MAG: hypothetical protein JXR07_00265 [Reichenbachiella sp.]
MTILQKLSALLLAIAFLAAVSCSPGSNKDANTEAPEAEETSTATEVTSELDSTTVEMSSDSTSVAEEDSTATE